MVALTKSAVPTPFFHTSTLAKSGFFFQQTGVLASYSHCWSGDVLGLTFAMGQDPRAVRARRYRRCEITLTGAD